MKNPAHLATILCSALISLSAITTAAEIETTVNFGLEGRYFFQSPQFQDQPENSQFSASLQPEIKWQSDNRDHRVSIIGFARLDSEDDDRTHVDIRELFYSRSVNDWTFTTGINKVFWGVTESVHLVDVINQVDFVEDIDQEDKLGQPMVHASVQKEWGRLEAFVLPYFRERTFSSNDGRFYFGLPISGDAAYESSQEENHTDLALRYSHYFGDIDLGLHVFEGTNRDPQLILGADAELTPFYSQMTQFGLDAQYTVDAWLFKLEALHRHTRFDNFFASVAGFEYTVFQVAQTNMDLGLLLEHQYDERDQSVTSTLADDDLFFGARLGFNDIQDTSILAGVLIDTENDTEFFNIEAERRIGNSLSAEFRARFLTNVDQNDPAIAFAQDDYAQLALNWFF